MKIRNPLKIFISIPFRVIRKVQNWSLSEPVNSENLQNQYPNVEFQNPQNIMVGKRVFIGAGCFFDAKTNIIIGNDTMIAPRVIIITNTHNPAQNPMWKTAIFRPVSIGERAWIGVGTVILPGVKIGDDAIIGAGAVISRHVPDRAVVVGNPARIVRFRDVPALDMEVQNKYPYWEDVYKDYLPEEQITKTLEIP